MTSMFDSNVYARRKHTPWARMSLVAFMKEMAFNEPHTPGDSPVMAVVLSVHYRPSVCTRFWYSLEFTASNGEKKVAESQELDLCLWRAAEMELQVQAKMKREEQAKKPLTCLDCKLSLLEAEAFTFHDYPLCEACFARRKDEDAEIELKIKMEESPG